MPPVGSTGLLDIFGVTSPATFYTPPKQVCLMHFLDSYEISIVEYSKF